MSERDPRAQQAQVAEKHAHRLELMVRCLSIPLAEDVAAMEAGIAALRAPSPVQELEALKELNWELVEALKGVAIVLNCGGAMREYDGEPWIGHVREALKKADHHRLSSSPVPAPQREDEQGVCLSQDKEP